MQRATIQPQLDESSHTYTIDGRRVISVTQAIREFVKIELYGEAYYVQIETGVAIRGDIFEEAQRFGRAIHKAGYYLLTGAGLSYDDLHPVLVPCLQQLEAWIEKYKPQVEMCEVSMYSRRYDFAGKPDFFGRLPMFKTGKDLGDIKTGMFEKAEIQLSAYEELIRENTGYKGEIRRWVLYLPKDGSDYQFIRMQRRDGFRYFLNALYNQKWREAA